MHTPFITFLKHIFNKIPDYFRTRPDPEVEELEKNLEKEAHSTMNSDSANVSAQKLNKICETLLEKIDNAGINAAG